MYSNNIETIMRRMILLLVLAVVVQNLHSLDTQATGDVPVPGGGLGFYFTPEYNRALNFCWALSTVGAVEFNERYTVKSGLALGGAGNTFDIKLFAGGAASLPIGVPLSVSVAYNYNGLPGYEAHSHSILPLVSLAYHRAGVSIGPNFRFTRFFGGQPAFESILAFGAYVNFITTDYLELGLRIANFDDFIYGNFGSYFLNLYSTVRLNEKLSLVNDIEIHQGGSVALTANFYGIVCRTGVLFSW